ncbi:hypothetical protein K8Z61_15310 [Nocardioides sp. TRM66260-LWL]|uniref:hypothetical protein n=1 Tax=Nocardioides sp. TRM66260-LWL TaxID=2874478 RepID=UPI001CC6C216|nr:hypothetical protein [Nocardioides sp. TRM66260-LWL]MBZ5735861.1 hypothetical protein [Nocardioides sp. TRM66260-LWL]
MPLHPPTGLADAALARSILACPAGAQLAVEDVDHLDLARVVLCEVAGVPMLGCPADSPLATAATLGRGAVLTLASGLPGRPGTLLVLGRLEAVRLERCACPCAEGARQVVRLDVRHVSLRTPDRPRRLVPADAFADPVHALNAGHLVRTAAHANEHHGELLRDAVAAATGVPATHVLGVELTGLTAHGVELAWVDVDGAHREGLAFPRPAADLDDLSLLLRDLLLATAR